MRPEAPSGNRNRGDTVVPVFFIREHDEQPQYISALLKFLCGDVWPALD